MEAERAMIGGNWEAKHNPLHRELLQDAAIIEGNLEAIHNIIIEEAYDAKETDFDTCRTDVAAAS